MISKRDGTFFLRACTPAILIAYSFLPRIPQPQSCHNIDDHRTWLAIPNSGDMTRNLVLLFWVARLLPFYMPAKIFEAANRQIFALERFEQHARNIGRLECRILGSLKCCQAESAPGRK
jgi:hypothetical protein